MSVRSDLRDLARGDAEPMRWRVARLLLRWAGALLATSHPHTLDAQTGTKSPTASWDRDVGVQLRATDWTNWTRRWALDRSEHHGLLLQLADASYRADRAEEAKRRG